MRLAARRGARVLLAVAVAASGAACGQGSASTSAPSETADQALAATAAAFARLTSFRMEVSAQRVSLSLDAHAGAEHGVQRFIGGPMAGVTLEYIELGRRVWFHGDALLRVQGIAAQYPGVGQNWFLDANSDGSAGLDTFIDPAKTAHCLIGRHGAVSFGEPSTVGGVAVLTVVAAAGGAGTTPETYFIAADGSHRLMRILQTGPTVDAADPKDTCENFGADPDKAGPQLTIDFSLFDQVSTITAPATQLHVP